MRLLKIIATLFVSLPVLWATIIEIDSLKEIKPIETTALVLFDIDDTLIRYPSHLGSEPWFREAHTQPNFYKYAALLASQIPVIPVEEQVVELIQTLQAHEITVMAITSRFLTHPALPNWIDKTVEQVESIGLSFSTAPNIEINTPHPSVYRNGILILGKNRKKEGIDALLKTLKSTSVILIDDKLSDIDDVEKSISVPFTGYWYRAIEKSRELYDSKAAWLELDKYLESSSEVNG